MASESELIRAEIDKISRGTGLGPLSDAYGHMLYGINHRGLGNPINQNQDNSGIVFFTRTDLNLSYDNLATRRTFMPYASNNIEHTLQRYCRVALDPRGAVRYRIQTPLFNNRAWFIPLLTNNLLSLTGWPDRTSHVFTSKPGVRKEVFSMLNGLFQYHGEFSLVGNFRNVQGNPIPSLMSLWQEYAEAAFLGEVMPYPHNVVENRVDSHTRIYILILDPGRRYVQTIASTLCVPTVDPTGSRLDFTADETFMQNSSQQNYNFLCNGLEVNDPILIREFNRRATRFDPGMEITSMTATDLKVRGDYFQLRGNEMKIGNYKGIPLIHPLSHELMWFVTRSEYDELYT